MALNLTKTQILSIVGGVVLLSAAGWFGWQYLEDTGPAPATKAGPQPVAPKPLGPAKAAKAADAGPTREKLIEDALLASGMKRQLEQLPQQLITGVREAGKQLPRASPAVVNAIENAVTESFTAQRFHDRVSANLKNNFDQKRLQTLLSDFSTPAAKRMIDLEQAASSKDAFARFARSQAGIRPSSQRAGVIKRIDAATRAGDLAVDIAFSSMKAVALGVVGEGPGKAAAVDKAIEKQRASATKKIRAATLLNLAFSFREASDAELAEFAGIYEAESSKWFIDIVYASLLEEVKSASAQAGARIGSRPGKPAAPAAKPSRSMVDADARNCLSMATNTAIIQCAEQYR